MFIIEIIGKNNVGSISNGISHVQIFSDTSRWKSLDHAQAAAGQEAKQNQAGIQHGPAEDLQGNVGKCAKSGGNFLGYGIPCFQTHPYPKMVT